jgi:peptide/nickel transport system substrate-binding protein
MTYAKEHKHLSLFLCLFLIVFGSIRCGRDEEGVSAGESKITVLFPGDEYSMNPYGGNSTDHLVFLPLFTTDETGELQPLLISRWEYSDDFQTWTIRLRDDVAWHDGKRVTAHDIKFSMELWAHPDVGMSAPGDRIAVLDDFTLKVIYKKASRKLLNDWQVFYPKHLLENLDPKEIESWDFWTHPVGNGPYRYVRHLSDIMMELEANPDYFQGKPRIERIVLKFGGTSKLTELLSGDVDVITYLSETDILELKNDPRFTVYHWINPNVFIAIFWNHRYPLFRDPVVRRALTLAINREELLKVLNMPKILSVFDVPFTKRQYGRREIPKPLPYDPKLASQLLEKAGWLDSDGDGIRENNGEKFQFSMLVSDREYSDEKPAVYIQGQLRKVGIRMDIRPLAFMPLHRRYRAGDFEAAIHVFDNFPGITTGYSSIGYDNPRVFQLHKIAETTIDLDKLDHIYKEIMEIHRKDVPLTFLYHVVNSTIARKSIKGLSTPFYADPVLCMEHLWIDKEN